jgi:filamentous hemagglutinin
MFVAVPDFASAHGNGACGASAEPAVSRPLRLNIVAFAAMVLMGSASTSSVAQIVAAPGSGAQVVQTQNGLNQVNIARPSSAGVSLNKYSQFDVPAKGAILNNSPTIVQTQQGGYINGNANLTPGQEARVIVNQVMSNAPSQLRGYVEVAGKRAEVIIANPNGLIVDGAGFINTSRAVLATGVPNFGPNGNVTGFTVNGGNIVVQGAGLNAGDVDQVDLLARAVQANATIYAKNLNAIAGANQIDHDTLAVTPMAGDGTSPAIAIDVSQLGGMYADRIYLASNEFGVGVSTRGVLAAQAGDLTLQSNGKLVLAGQTNASGNFNATARDGIDNTGTTYAKGNVSASSSGALTNSGVLAAQQNTSVSAGNLELEPIKPRHTHSRQRWIRRIAPKFRHHFPHTLESSLRIDHENRHIDHIIERAIRCLKNRIQVAKRQPYLLLQIRLRRAILAAAHLSRHKKQATRPHRRRIAIAFIKCLTSLREDYIAFVHRRSPLLSMYPL